MNGSLEHRTTNITVKVHSLMVGGKGERTDTSREQKKATKEKKKKAKEDEALGARLFRRRS